jgi:hypothetical protein
MIQATPKSPGTSSTVENAVSYDYLAQIAQRYRFDLDSFEYISSSLPYRVRWRKKIRSRTF